MQVKGVKLYNFASLAYYDVAVKKATAFSEAEQFRRYRVFLLIIRRVDKRHTSAMKRYRGDCRVIRAYKLVKLCTGKETLISWSNVGYPADGCYYCCHNSVWFICFSFGYQFRLLVIPSYTTPMTQMTINRSISMARISF